MSIDKVRLFFAARGMENRVREFDVSSATVELAAQAIGCEAKRIAKSLTFLVNGGCVMIVAAGDARVDNAAFKHRFGVKPAMLKAEQVTELVGHAVGGVCPFAVNEGVQVFLDESLRRFRTVFPACGSSNSCIELTIGELEHTSGYVEWVDVCKSWREEPSDNS